MDDGCLGAGRCLDAVKPAYEEAVAAGKAVGVALGLKNSGLGNGFKEVAKAIVRFEKDGSVEVRHCWTEMGQGVHTVALQVAVEELGVDPRRVTVKVDTTRELGAGQTTGSRATLMTAGSVLAACKAADAAGRKSGIDYPGEYRVDWTNSLYEGVANPVIHSTFGYAAHGYRRSRERGIECGRPRRRRRPLLCGQVEGASHGSGSRSARPPPTSAAGKPHAESLQILKPADMPASVILVEPQPAPYGIKGVRNRLDSTAGQWPRPSRSRRRLAEPAADEAQA
jgi:hypothetical protein